MSQGLEHLNNRERAVRLAQRKARRDDGRGWGDPAPLVPSSDGACLDDPAEAAIRFNVEAVKTDIANIARSFPGGGLTYGWFGDRLSLQFPNSPEVLTVDEAVRRRLVGPDRIW